ncbi:hypothetical protein VNO77_25122 [Canavalia gladiata]|uniref:Uncharacterized protein n=1 Tax=Canavalia gladiata TaxID=3824 RepID=A0AAN9L862_CANGL
MWQVHVYTSTSEWKANGKDSTPTRCSVHYQKRKRGNLNLSQILAKVTSTGSVPKVIHVFQANRKSRKTTALYDIQELVDINTATSLKQISCRGTIQLGTIPSFSVLL